MRKRADELPSHHLSSLTEQFSRAKKVARAHLRVTSNKRMICLRLFAVLRLSSVGARRGGKADCACASFMSIGIYDKPPIGRLA